MKLSYRPEIDGLRTLAVLAVLLYHAELWWGSFQLFRGGFLGVDVFFVISGYLITSILHRELLDQGKISFARFYERRARRLLPALLLVIFVSIPIAWKLLLPGQLVDFAKSILSSLGFVSNFYWYFSLQEYGAESALVKPFLHTWSLAIEEQYYLVFPVILVLLYRYRPRNLIAGFVILIGISLGVAEWLSAHNPSASFYLLPSRLWELLSGGLLTLIASRVQNHSQYRVIYRFLPGLGLLFIAGSMLIVDHSDNHPGVITLFPVVGTSLIILFAKPGTWVCNGLSSRFFVGVGIISYSLYLWHYPIFAFGRIIEPIPSIQDKLIWMALSFLLATATYIMVEKPFRRRSIVPNVPMISSLGSGAIAVCALMVVVILQGGFQQRLNTPDLDKYQISKYLDRAEFRSFQHPKGVVGTNFDTNKETVDCYKRTPHEACRIGDELVITLGDSFVAQYDRALYEILQSSGHGMVSLGHGQCPFVSSNMYFSPQNSRCGEVNKRRWDVIENLDSPRVFLVAANEAQFPNVKFYDPSSIPAIKGPWERRQLVWDSYIGNINKLASMGHKVVVIGTVPYPSSDAKALFLASMLRDPDSVDTVFSESDNSKILKVDARNYSALSGPNVLLIEPARSLCQIHQKEASRCLMVTSQGPIYNETRHLSYFGAKLVLEYVASQLSEKGWSISK